MAKAVFCSRIESMGKKINKFIYWTPRMLGIIFVLFLMMFSLDVFEPGLTAQQIAIGLFMHNIPALFLLLILIISWRHEIVGGVFFILAGLLYILFLAINPKFEWYMLSWSVIIAGPAFLIGILFIKNWLKKTPNSSGKRS
jgi:K+-sensing histidine kinase KdpD